MNRPQPVYSAAQWEQHKETIRRLYRDEEKTLDDVAATMARDFDFHATRKQYLDRINKWCYGKNIRSNVMMCVAIIRERRRRRHGKETLFRYNGREIDAKRIDRFVRERCRDRSLTEMELTQPTPECITYTTPNYPSDNLQNQFEYFSQLAGPEYDNDIALTADLMDLAPTQGLMELPPMTVLAYTAVRSLRYQELAIAYAVHSGMEYITPSSIPSREDIYNLSLGALQIELDDTVGFKDEALGLLVSSIEPTDIHGFMTSIILEYLVRRVPPLSILDQSSSQLRFVRIPLEAVASQQTCGLLEYASLYWAKHLCGITRHLPSHVENDLVEFLRSPKSLAWIESLAILRPDDFEDVISRILASVTQFYDEDGIPLRSETVRILRNWVPSIQQLLGDWKTVLRCYPGEVHYIEPCLLPQESLFRDICRGPVLPVVNVLNSLDIIPPMNTLEQSFSGLIRSPGSSGNAIVLDMLRNRLFVANRTRYRDIEASKFLSWEIKCIDIKTGLVLARLKSRSEFESLGHIWDHKSASVEFQLKMSNDYKYLAYEERLNLSKPEQTTHVFTYVWQFQDGDIIDGNLFGPRTTVNNGLLIPTLPYEFGGLAFNLRRNVLFTAGLPFDLSLPLQSGSDFRGHFHSGLRSLHICPNGKHVVVARQPKEEPVGLLLELWELGSASPKFTRTFWGRFVSVFAVSPSGRFVAISKEKQLLRRRPQETEEERFPFTILDTETGSESTLFRYMGFLFESSAHDYHTSRRPENVFFGNIEPRSSLFLTKRKQDNGPGIGYIWRWMQGGWANIGQIQLSWACKPIEFSSDDSHILGIASNGFFSVDSGSLRETVVALEGGLVGGQEEEHHLRHWAETAVYYLNSEVIDGDSITICGNSWKLEGTNPFNIPTHVQIASPVPLGKVAGVWVPTPSDHIYFTTENNNILVKSAIGTSPSPPSIWCDPDNNVHGKPEIITVGPFGRYICKASFEPGGNHCGDKEMVKDLRIDVCSAAFHQILRTVYFHGKWSRGKGDVKYIYDATGVSATFHPNVPILAWSLEYFNLGLWLMDFSIQSRPVFIEIPPSYFTKSFSSCGRYFWVLSKPQPKGNDGDPATQHHLTIFDLQTGGRSTYSWKSNAGYGFGHVSVQSDILYVVGIQDECLLGALSIKIGTSDVFRACLMSVPHSYQKWSQVETCYWTDGEKLNVVLVGEEMKSNGPSGFVAGFDRTSQNWVAAIDVDCALSPTGGIRIQQVGFSHELESSEIANPRSLACQADIEVEKNWCCREWSITNDYKYTLISRSYDWS